MWKKTNVKKGFISWTYFKWHLAIVSSETVSKFPTRQHGSTNSIPSISESLKCHSFTFISHSGKYKLTPNKITIQDKQNFWRLR